MNQRITVLPTDHYVIRPAAAGDGPTLLQLAQLNSQRPLSGPALIGEIDGIPAAALSLSDGRLIADPFERTAVLSELLRTRAEALHPYPRAASLAEAIRAAIRRFRRRGMYGAASTSPVGR